VSGWEELGKLVPVGKIYDDALSPTAKEVGKFGADVAKTARLILAPLQVTAAFQDRLASMLERIRNRVPESRQIEAPAEVVGPAIEHMRYVDESSPLWTMYEEVLTKSVDADQATKVHPSFTHLVAQLSRDEAWILYRLRGRGFKVVDHLDYDHIARRFSNRTIEKSELPNNELYLPDKIELYYAHLESLGLVTWPVEREEYPKNTAGHQIGLRRYSTMMLTDFGRLFVAACIPDEGFEQHAKK
jgi:hypothetical protein